VGVPHTVKLTWSESSQAIWAQATGGQGALLVSPFNVKWRFSAPGGGVEGSKLCLFSMIMPAKCVSSFSPRFHYRRLAFCFLPLAAILESLYCENFCKCPILILLNHFSEREVRGAGHSNPCDNPRSVDNSINVGF
jgi:hypothetical protein